ncbi:Crp/Fnr family transcriptional regulator [Xanthocytophaga flava]|uniref:Crp/Fnr family transcriptional regulator n=1 Tax=Xanthocytophaga flava TaxID=3048013 RepID=UPI0028D4EF13|nr:Crp/Fnr family transcriptional regulator [Xanthocytophaga flavus]MDJ1470408.1 Crp/Fnr family transcriptional regulator [Xanthocytophaga flavus]
MLGSLQTCVNQIVRLDDAAWNAFSQLFTESMLKRGEYFAEAGRQEHEIGFLTKGVVRAFYRNGEGQEYNKTFFTDNEFIGAYASLVMQVSNQINLQALTDCSILVANYNEITTLFEHHRTIETFARKMAEYFYVYKEKREIDLVLLQADERYKRFQQEYPDLENQIPQYHIASYLGITPTQLSRIRSKK